MGEERKFGCGDGFVGKLRGELRLTQPQFAVSQWISELPQDGMAMIQHSRQVGNLDHSGMQAW